MLGIRLATGSVKSGAVSPLSDDIDPQATATLAMSVVAKAIRNLLVEKPWRMRSTGIRIQV